MRFYYGQRNVLRIMDEVEFWKQQEQEHTVVIRQITEGLEPTFVKLLEEWEQAFAQTEATAVKYIEAIIRSNYQLSPPLEQKIISFINYSLNQSRKFLTFLNQMTMESKAVRQNPVAQVVINHIRRESEYFIGIVTVFLDGTGASPH